MELNSEVKTALIHLMWCMAECDTIENSENSLTNEEYHYILHVIAIEDIAFNWKNFTLKRLELNNNIELIIQYACELLKKTSPEWILKVQNYLYNIAFISKENITLKNISPSELNLLTKISNILGVKLIKIKDLPIKIYHKDKQQINYQYAPLLLIYYAIHHLIKIHPSFSDFKKNYLELIVKQESIIINWEIFENILVDFKENPEFLFSQIIIALEPSSLEWRAKAVYYFHEIIDYYKKISSNNKIAPHFNQKLQVLQNKLHIINEHLSYFKNANFFDVKNNLFQIWQLARLHLIYSIAHCDKKLGDDRILTKEEHSLFDKIVNFEEILFKMSDFNDERKIFNKNDLKITEHYLIILKDGPQDFKIKTLGYMKLMAMCSQEDDPLTISSKEQTLLKLAQKQFNISNEIYEYCEKNVLK
ncbi:MAG: hypothetical protein QM539_04450 [Alphaproteobacteria bacterium]|nr:hypothetical protein [Alphaproteobacteria bacterium]